MAMQETRVTLSKRRIALQLAVGASLILVLVYFVGATDIASEIWKVNYWIYFFAFIIFTLSYVLYTFSWMVMLRVAEIRLRFLEAFGIVWFSLCLDLLIPTGNLTGELARVAVTAKRSGSDFGKSLASVGVHKIMSLGSFLGGAFLGFLYVLVNFNLPVEIIALVSILLTGSTLPIIFLLLIIFDERDTVRFVKMVFRFLRRVGKRWLDRINRYENSLISTLDSFHRNLRVLAVNRRSLLASALLSVCSSVLNILVVYFVFLSLGAHVHILTLLAVFSVALMIQFVPIGLPGMLGLVEMAMTGLFTALGVTLNVSATATLLTRVIVFWVPLAVGMVVSYWFLKEV